jgi:hypothetical protein
MKKVTCSTLAIFCLFFILIGQASAQDPGDSPAPATKTEIATTEATSTDVASTKVETTEVTYTGITNTAPIDEVPSNPILSVVEAKICEGIIDKEPIAPGDVFSKDIPVLYCFSRIKSSEASEIRHIWYFQDKPVSEIPLSIGTSSGWRTYSSKNISLTSEGNWKVEIINANGDILKTIQFVVN